MVQGEATGNQRENEPTLEEVRRRPSQALRNPLGYFARDYSLYNKILYMAGMILEGRIHIRVAGWCKGKQEVTREYNEPTRENGTTTTNPVAKKPSRLYRQRLLAI